MLQLSDVYIVYLSRQSAKGPKYIKHRADCTLSLTIQNVFRPFCRLPYVCLFDSFKAYRCTGFTLFYPTLLFDRSRGRGGAPGNHPNYPQPHKFSKIITLLMVFCGVALFIPGLALTIVGFDKKHEKQEKGLAFTEAQKMLVMGRGQILE